ncbi:tripartite motif-containing protein 16-like protein [Cyprinodon tularosa]|uniref:Tripartite motif-containing protein 16-like protein n=1 Tax=Cyprinodon variegatus TaxID=28743 RepID=A0A3Q2E9C0_CYPVA|nr:PREDICTED: tripartite motif-containing protein 16-like protein [Cyprinodon variegatus]XP_038156908.1 tripartite motif-containing protein 16-like protein [Cyprinodon tularosa]
MQRNPKSTTSVPEHSKSGKLRKSKKNEKTNAEGPPVYLPDIPEPKSRAELMKYWIDLTLDKKTANKMLWISDDFSKVSRRTKEVCPVLDGPDRYEYSPQVLCKESIWNQRGYWEVEYSGWVAVGATFDEAARRANSELSGLGENEHSWGLCWSGSCYQIWFNCNHEDITEVPFCSTIAMYIDQPAGIINFYIVPGEGTEKEVRLLHQVKTVIDKKILPGFWLGVQSSCTLLKKTD